MQTNLLEYLENTVKRVPDKLAFADEKGGLTFGEVYDCARAVGSYLYRNGHYREPVIIFMKKSPQTVTAFFGTLYAGCLYVPIDEEMPAQRIALILKNLHPRAMICDMFTREAAKTMIYEGAIYQYEEICTEAVDEQALLDVRADALDIDPVYIVFTSGSTGVPKGVVACHRSVIDYIEQLSETLGFSEQTVFGNQSPFYFDACLKELYPTIKFGATTYIIPKTLFSFPVKLVDFLNEYKINTVCWVVSALTMISGFGVLETKKPEYLHTIAFGSEVFPIRQFNLWKDALPEAAFTNLYGPTEATGMSCYYHADRKFELSEVIPIGRPFKNTQILLLKEDNTLAGAEEEGEICIRGTAVTMGYYNDFKRTSESFVQNPLNKAYPELIYRTGDIGRYNAEGELIFVSRKDYQIKHMGHRIELGEIEANVNQIEEIRSSCCIYDKEQEKIILFYTGEIEPRDVIVRIKEALPRYMVPNRVRHLDKMPLTPNGKLNRVLLRQEYEKEKGE
ncbi:MAG: amino acid adenylation domain-containing protein [Lachnospiraceae bacterium]|nr:amino acid adenylation domain-containing protein [Lachnospiraceae bacterium]